MREINDHRLQVGLRQYMIGEKLKETSLKCGCPATQQKLFPKI